MDVTYQFLSPEYVIDGLDLLNLYVYNFWRENEKIIPLKFYPSHDISCPIVHAACQTLNFSYIQAKYVCYCLCKKNKYFYTFVYT